MEKEELKKTNNEKNGGLLKVVIVFILIIIAGLVGYFVGVNGLFEEKDNSGIDNQDAKNLVEGYSFNMKDVACQKEENSCTKEVKVSYNNENHVAKVVTSVTGEGKNVTKYALYLDGNEVYSVADSGLRLSPGEDINTYLDTEGYIYIFDKTNIAFVLPIYIGKMGYTAYIFNSDNSYMRTLTVAGPGMTMLKDGKNYNGDFQFDGHTLKVWDRDCKDDTKAIQYGITIENQIVVFKQLQSISGVESSGLMGCAYKNETIS